MDDHPITRRGVKEVLEDTGAFEVVAQAADGTEAVTRGGWSRGRMSSSWT